MTNEERYYNTMEKLHDVEVPAFNPNYDAEKAKMVELQDKFMRKIKEELVKLYDNDLNGNTGICNKIEDICYVYSCAINNMYSFNVENGKIVHRTERGQKLADVFNN